MNVNLVFIAGNLTRDPEARTIPNGTTVARLAVALNRKWKDRVSGEWKEATTFVDVEAWGQPAEFCVQYLHKGSSVFVEGELESQSWEDRATGQKRSKLLVKARRVQSDRVDQPRTEAPAKPLPAPAAQPAGDDAFDVEDSIDDIPL